MKKRRRRDIVLLLSLLALWMACTAVHVKQVYGGRLAWVGVYVAAAEDGSFPRVRGFWPGSAPAARGELAVGDRLLAVDGVDLRGVGPFGFVARAGAAASGHGDLRLELAYDCGGVAGRTAITLVPVAFPWRMLPLTCTLVLSAALVLARRPGTRVARAFFLAGVAYGLHWTFFFGGSPMQSYAWALVFFLSSLVVLPLMLRAVLVFPAEVAPKNGRMPRWPWVFAIFGPISLSWVYGVPLPPEVGFRAVFAVNIAFIVTLLAVVTRNFLRAGPIGRRQLEWVVLGMYLGTVPVLLADVAAAAVPSLWWLHEIAVMAEIVVPLCILMAIVRYNYFDVDRLITGTAVYSVLSVLLLAAVLAAVPRLARVASEVAGLDHRTAQVILSLVVAAAMVPAHRALTPRMERVLFHERHALRAGVEDLLRELAAVSGFEELLTSVGERLAVLVRPRSCVIYAPIGGAFEPVFARGEQAENAPILPAQAVVIGDLEARAAALDLSQWSPTSKRALGDEEHSALEQLHAAVLLPVWRAGDLAAVICLGAKRSGDVYTATDLTLLAAVADKVSSELLRFDHELIVRQERAMSEALLRYVPRPVAARLSRGQSIEGGEREVSVLFVDIRGYSTYSEARDAEAVFAMINRYAEAVSAVIQRRGGTVVEFLGDGLMAVFGAPEALPDHARVSVQAAREVVAAVHSLDLGRLDGEPPISVGVGIASGEAFVGNVRTSDRLVYTAVGDVVNLASRIQGLTRDLGVAVAIDAQTHRSAGESARSFKRHERMRIRGRAEPIDVYALPLVAA